MAEASLAVTFKPAGGSVSTVGVDAAKLASEGVVKPGSKELVSVGRPLAGVDVEIRDDRGRQLRPGRVGRVFVRGPSIMAGYFGRPDLTAEVLHGDWLDSGDLGFVHDSELFLCGRRKEIVIVRGANHAPQDFEAALDGLSGVRSGCAVAVGFAPADGAEEALAMLVETTSDAPPTLAQDVASRVQERTGILPAHVELLAPGTLPKTTSGKLRRREARIHWLAGTLSPPKKVTAVKLVRQAISGEVSHARASLSRLAANKRMVG
jgi:acyl-CoA synthetase (AMP-forming)/AMP-acid ligase II